MAIGIHAVEVVGRTRTFAGTVVADATYPNSSGGPSLKAYLILEAAAGYISPTGANCGPLCVTYSVSDTNSA
jgi:hypothetical protein